MKNVRWSDNSCTVGGTCIHGFFNGPDLEKLLELCPEGNFTPTFYSEKFYRSGCGLSDIQHMKNVIYWNGKTLYDTENGYYFTFMENDGADLLEYLKTKFPMVRGE